MRFSIQNAFYIQRTISRVHQKHLGCRFLHVHQNLMGCRLPGLNPDAWNQNLWREALEPHV